MSEENQVKVNTKKILRIVSAIISAIVLAIILIYGIKLLKWNSTSSGRTNNTLGAPEGINYDEDEYLITWNAVENADNFVVEVNNFQAQVGTNSMSYIAMTENTTIKVKAMDSKGTYKDSEWSNIYTYILQDEFSYSKVCAYLNKLLPSSPLQKIVGAYVEGYSFFVNGVFEVNGQMKLEEYEIEYAIKPFSVTQAINQNPIRIRTFSSLDIAEYDSASYLLQSNSFSGEMEQRRLEGWKFGVVASQVAKTGNPNYHIIYATYEITKGQETKYIVNKMECYVPNLSSSERNNYTTRLVNTESRILKELYYVELTGDAFVLAQAMANLPK